MTTMDVPSGRVFRQPDLDLVRLMAEHGFIRWLDERVPVSSGLRFRLYVSGRDEVTDHPELQWQLGRRLMNTVWDSFEGVSLGGLRPCLIGVPMAGTTLAHAAALADHREWHVAGRQQLPICHRVISS